MAAMQPLQVEVVFDELGSQMIQQCCVAGGIGQVHIIGWIDDSDAEVVAPNSVDDGFGKVWVFRRTQPLHQGTTRVLVERERFVLDQGSFR